LALKRFGDKPTATDIMKSLKERSVSNEELGMFWRDTEYSFFWYRAPIETQALMIEAFDEVMNDGEAVEDCKIWLLKQKQTQDWKTTKGTADAVYALLLRGGNWLSSDALVDVKLGNIDIKAANGRSRHRLLRAKVPPHRDHAGDEPYHAHQDRSGRGLGQRPLAISRGHEQDHAPRGNAAEADEDALQARADQEWPVLEAIKGPLAVGDEIVVRVTLHTDRDMEYVHLKDYRGSGTEPTNVLSQYKYQDGLAYYESTKDTASHFFIDYLPKGAYVF